MPTFTDPQEPLAPGRAELAAWAALLALVTASRWTVAPAELFEWDSANYALGVLDFNVFEHRPHPPGYPLFVLLLKLATPLFGMVRAFVAVNALLTAGTLLFVASMARPRIGPAGAWALAASIAACPLFWMHGAASTAYVAEGFCSAGTAAVALAVLRGQLPLAWAAVAWGVLLGIRTNGALTLTPLMAWTAWHRRAEIPAALAAGAVTCTAWLVPTALQSGGLGPLREATSALSDWQFKTGSALAGDLDAASHHATSLVTYVLDALNLGLLALAPALFWRPSIDRRSLGFFAVWLTPAVAYYTLHHLPKSGYALTVIPAAGLLVALASARAPRWAAGVATLYVAVNVALFHLAVPWEAWAFGDAPELVPDRVRVFGDYSAKGLAYRTRPLRVLDAELDAADPDRDAVVFLTGSHELHRLAMATRPEFPLVAVFTEHGIAWSSKGEQGFGSYQLEILRAPKLRGTDRKISTVIWDGRTMRIERRGDQVDFPLTTERALIIVPCEPCLIANPGPAEATGLVEFGAGFRGVWLTSPRGPDFD